MAAVSLAHYLAIQVRGDFAWPRCSGVVRCGRVYHRKNGIHCKIANFKKVSDVQGSTWKRLRAIAMIESEDDILIEKPYFSKIAIRSFWKVPPKTSWLLRKDFFVLLSYWQEVQKCRDLKNKRVWWRFRRMFSKKSANWLMIKEKLGKFSWQSNENKKKKIKE